MSVDNGKVCCNCRHNIRTGEVTNIKCHCDIDGSYIGYVQCLEYCCRHWSPDRPNRRQDDLEYFQSDCYSMEELKKCPVCEADLTGGEQ